MDYNSQGGIEHFKSAAYTFSSQFMWIEHSSMVLISSLIVFPLQEIEDQLKIRKRQQASEMRKTSAELRDTDARYSAQRSKVTALEKENAW